MQGHTEQAAIGGAINLPPYINKRRRQQDAILNDRDGAALLGDIKQTIG